MVPADLVPRVFSTAGLPRARRVELWEAHNATALIGLDVHATEPLEATELNVQLPRVQLARVAGSAHMVERTADVIERSPADAIALYLTLRGDAWFRQQGQARTLRPGSVLACGTDRPFARGFARGLEELVIKVPRAAFEAQAGMGVPGTAVTATFASDPYARALARMTGRAVTAGHPVPADEHTLLDLVAVLVAGPDTGRAVAHRAAARAYIEEHLTDPNLGAGQIAAAIGISERQLSRVFAADGTSVPRHILSRRLHRAHAMLAMPTTNQTGTVAEIAGRCGFTSVTYFSHAFRARFGQRAGDIRRDTRTWPA
jgi:AraC-like DNA-binding protein